MEDYIQSVQDDTFEEKGWPLRSYLTKAGLSSTYSVSKVGVSALTRLQQHIMDTSNRDLDIVINCVHPGFVNTDMSSHRGHFTPEEGAKPIIYAAKLPEKSMIRGKFIWYDCTIVFDLFFALGTVRKPFDSCMKCESNAFFYWSPYRKCDRK